ncbi:hypothetical protein DFH11DRAFT_1879994 [Phellopilus nigrolimitatus]|nr:hypothetical protein DFH11DRAFT_1879994 [Phellopilus nigrolimitatus]
MTTITLTTKPGILTQAQASLRARQPRQPQMPARSAEHATATKDGPKSESSLKRAAHVDKKAQKQNPSTPSATHVRKDPKPGVPEASNARAADVIKPSIRTSVRQDRWSPVRRCNVCDCDIIVVPPARLQSSPKSHLRTSKPESKSKSTIAYPRIQKCGREYFGMECRGFIEVSAQDNEKARLVPPEEIERMQRWNYNYGERLTIGFD